MFKILLNRLDRKTQKTNNNLIELGSKIEPDKQRVSGQCIKLALSIPQKTPTLTSEVVANRFFDLMRDGGYSRKEVEAVLLFLYKKNFMWLDTKRNRICVNGIIFNCTNCSNFEAGDGWHKRSQK